MEKAANLKTSLTFLDGAIDELNAIKTYVSLILTIDEQKDPCLSNCVCEDDKPTTPPTELDESVRANYTEIIADELNHLERFVGMFVEYSQIEPKED